MADPSFDDRAPFALAQGPERGAWLATRLAARGPALAWLVPSGYDALIRVLHPFTRDQPIGLSWAEYERMLSEMAATGDWGDSPGFSRETVSWATAAQALASTADGPDVNPAVASHDLLKPRNGDRLDQVAADGYRYSPPDAGRLEPRTLAALAKVLALHTETPARGTVGIWEGWGTSGSKYANAPRSAALPSSLERLQQWWSWLTSPLREHRQNLAAAKSLLSTSDRAVDSQQPTDGPRSADTDPRLELPDRGYICFDAGIIDFVTSPDANGIAGWAGLAPWVRPEFAVHAHSPSLMWPEGREWFVVSEIDFDSTLVACSPECADALLSAPGLETVEIDRDTPLAAAQ